MARRTQFVIFLSVFVSFVFAEYSGKCIQESPCSCKFDDGKKINLEKLGKNDFLTAVYNLNQVNTGYNLTYYFHACSDKKPTFPSYLKNLKDDCGKTSLCLLNQTTTGNATNVTTTATTINLGNARDAKFRFTTNSEKYMVFNQDKYNITTIIHLECTPDFSESNLYFKQIDSTTGHNLILFSKEICPIYVKVSELSTGSVLVILLLTFSAVYLLGGAAILHFLRGARGKEMIPNLEFWTDLPCLVKDGAVFLQNGCKPTISNSESYDRI